MELLKPGCSRKAVTTEADPKTLVFSHNDNPFQNKPQEAVVNIDKEVLRSAEDHGLRPREKTTTKPFPWLRLGRPGHYARPKNVLQVANPKRALCAQSSEVELQPLLQDMGLPSAVQGLKEDNGGVMLKVVSQGVPRYIPLSDIGDFLNMHTLEHIGRQRRITATPVVAISVPNGASSSYRAAAAASMARQLDRFRGNSILKDNLRDPLVLVVPECVAAARSICAEHKVPDSTRVMVVDVGHSTIGAAIMTCNDHAPPTDLVQKAHNYRGVQDVELGLLRQLVEQQPAVVATVMKEMARLDKFQPGIELMRFLSSSLENASSARSPDEIVSDVEGPCGLELTLADVLGPRALLAEGVEQVVRCLLQLNRDAGKAPPVRVFLTGGGCQVPEVLQCVRAVTREALQWSAQQAADAVLASKGGNCPEVAQGDAFLGQDLFMKLVQLERQGRPLGLPAPGSGYTDLLPELWQGPAGVNIGVLLEFSPNRLPKSVSRLQELQKRLLPAAPPTIGSNSLPDYQQRTDDGDRLQQYLQQRKQGLAAKQKVLRETLIFYAVVLPEEPLPQTRKLPLALGVPSGSDKVSLRVVKQDPLHGPAEVTVGYVDIPCGKNDFVELTLEVETDCNITYSAVKKQRADDPGQPVEVFTEHDSLEAERRDSQRRLPQLPPLGRQFKRWLSGQEEMDVSKIIRPPEQQEAAAGAAMGTAAAAAAAAAAGDVYSFEDMDAPAPFAAPKRQKQQEQGGGAAHAAGAVQGRGGANSAPRLMELAALAAGLVGETGQGRGRLAQESSGRAKRAGAKSQGNKRQHKQTE